MELVYLWIQDYKNIKNTGFSLNSKYEIIYNQEKNVITCNYKHNYNSQPYFHKYNKNHQ